MEAAASPPPTPRSLIMENLDAARPRSHDLDTAQLDGGSLGGGPHVPSPDPSSRKTSVTLCRSVDYPLELAIRVCVCPRVLMKSGKP